MVFDFFFISNKETNYENNFGNESSIQKEF